MKLHWFPMESCDETFFETAPQRFVKPMDLPVPAEQVWRGLTNDGPLDWCRVLTTVTWTSPPPFGPGTTRTAKVLGAVVLHERFFRWEDGRRHSFFVFESNLPLYRRFAEDYLVEETSASTCRFTWSIVAEPRSWSRWVAPPVVGSLIRNTRSHFVNH